MKWLRVRTPSGDVVRIEARQDEDGIWIPLDHDAYEKYAQDAIVGIEEDET